VFQLDPRQPSVLGKLKAEATPHRATASGAVPHGEPRDVEREIEADDRGAKLVAEFKEDVLNEIRCGQQFEPFRSGKTGEYPLVVLRQRRWIIEEPVPSRPIDAPRTKTPFYVQHSRNALASRRGELERRVCTTDITTK
jgi:hypothetical protein